MSSMVYFKNESNSTISFLISPHIPIVLKERYDNKVALYYNNNEKETLSGKYTIEKVGKIIEQALKQQSGIVVEK